MIAPTSTEESHGLCIAYRHLRGGITSIFTYLLSIHSQEPKERHPIGGTDNAAATESRRVVRFSLTPPRVFSYPVAIWTSPVRSPNFAATQSASWYEDLVHEDDEDAAGTGTVIVHETEEQTGRQVKSGFRGRAFAAIKNSAICLSLSPGSGRKVKQCNSYETIPAKSKAGSRMSKLMSKVKRFFK